MDMLPLRLMTDPPSRTGRYAVLHSGHTVGHAWYWHPDDVANKEKYHDPLGTMRAGWQQLPPFGPTHWIDLYAASIEMGDYKRFWADKHRFPADKPYYAPPVSNVKKSLFKRIFSW